jgi:hypothetical protein
MICVIVALVVMLFLGAVGVSAAASLPDLPPSR